MDLRLVDPSIPIQPPVDGELHGGDDALLWEAHRVGIDHEYFQIEELCNLGALPPRGFWISCFPVKIARASAGWCRAVATFGLEG